MVARQQVSLSGTPPYESELWAHCGLWDDCRPIMEPGLLTNGGGDFWMGTIAGEHVMCTTILLYADVTVVNVGMGYGITMVDPYHKFAINDTVNVTGPHESEPAIFGKDKIVGKAFAVGSFFDLNVGMERADGAPVGVESDFVIDAYNGVVPTVGRTFTFDQGLTPQVGSAPVVGKVVDVKAHTSITMNVGVSS